MKMVLLLIKTLACILCIGLFMLFMYYTLMQQQSVSVADNTLANITLLLFVLSVLIFALGGIWLENMNAPSQDKKDALQQYIDSVNAEQNHDQLQHHKKQLNDLQTQLNNLQQLLQRIAGTDVKTYKTLNMGLENLINRLDKLENMHLRSSNATNDDEGYDEEENMAMLHQPVLDNIFNQELAKAISDLNREPEKKFEDININELLKK